jgi:hypothetical protein
MMPFNFSLRIQNIVIVLFVIFLTVGLRLWTIDTGLQNDGVDVCQLPEQEHWIYDEFQPTSAYAWSIGLDEYPQPIPPNTRLVLPNDGDLWLARYAGVVMGVASVALMMLLGLRWHSQLWWLMGLLVACSPWFVEADRWVVAYDGAVLCVALAVWFRELAQTNQAWHIPQGIVAVLLLLVAPPLVWLIPFLLLSKRYIAWRAGSLTFLTMLLLIPAIQSPYHWFNALSRSDVGILSALIWLGLATIMYRWRKPNYMTMVVGLSVVIILGAYTVVKTGRIPSLSDNQRALINHLQQRLPDSSIVRWDGYTDSIEDIVACPLDMNIQLQNTPWLIPRPYRPGVYLPTPEPQYVVWRTDNERNLEENIANVNYITEVGQYRVGRLLDVPNVKDIAFGDLVYLIGHDLPESITVGSLLNIRLDMQLGLRISPDILGYAYYLHIVPTGERDSIAIRHDILFQDFMGQLSPRNYLLNHHAVMLVPEDITTGQYDVWFGVYNIYDGIRLATEQGSEILLGQFTIYEPETP